MRTRNHAFALLWVISLIIAAGITTEYTKPLYLFLYENIFFFKGFREPQKFIGIAAPTKKYVIFTEPGAWQLGASPRQKHHPVNVFEYAGGREITRETAPRITGAIISAVALICLLITLKPLPLYTQQLTRHAHL